VQDNQKHVVACYGRTLSKAKKKYCMTWQVLLAIVKAKEHILKYPYVHWPQQPNQYLKERQHNGSNVFNSTNLYTNTDELFKKPCLGGKRSLSEVRQTVRQPERMSCCCRHCGWLELCCSKKGAADGMGPILQEVKAEQHPV
jgi:hypothetical protein